MQLHFSFKDDSRTFRISDEKELIKLKGHYEKYCKDPNSIKGGYYTFEVEGGKRFQNKDVKFDEIYKMEVVA
jgi:hypothetical protein